jgi:hypothetical protein
MEDLIIGSVIKFWVRSGQFRAGKEEALLPTDYRLIADMRSLKDRCRAVGAGFRGGACGVRGDGVRARRLPSAEPREPRRYRPRAVAVPGSRSVAPSIAARDASSRNQAAVYVPRGHCSGERRHRRALRALWAARFDAWLRGRHTDHQIESRAQRRRSPSLFLDRRLGRAHQRRCVKFPPPRVKTASPRIRVGLIR